MSGPAAASSDNDTVFPLAENGTWICEAVSEASRTGAGASSLLADSTRAPSTLSNAPGAAGLRAVVRRAHHPGIAQPVRSDRRVDSISIQRGINLVPARVQFHVGGRRRRQVARSAKSKRSAGPPIQDRLR